MRAAFIGKTLDGHYGNGLAWTEAYLEDGRLDYRESQRQAARQLVFPRATSSAPSTIRRTAALDGGCWTAIKASANCYEFYLAGLTADAHRGRAPVPALAQRWNARGLAPGANPRPASEKPSVVMSAAHR